MSFSSPYSSTKSATSNTTVKKRTLKDNSWIRNDGDDSFETEEDTEPMYKTGSVSNLTKRFGGSQDLDKSNTSPSKTTIISPNSSVKTSSSTTTTTIKTETKTATPSKPALPSKPASSPVKTSFTDRVFSANKTSTEQYSSPSKTTTVTTTTTKNTPDGKTTTVTTTTKETTNGIKTSSPTSFVNIKTSVESTPKSPAPVPPTSTLDDLADTLIDFPTSDSTSVKSSYSTRKSSYDTPKTTQKYTEVVSISGSNLDQLADTLDPFSSSIPPPPSVKAPTSPLDNRYDSLQSPTKTVKESYETSYSKSTKYSPGDQFISSSTSTSVQSLSKRSLSDRNLCSFCHQPITDSIRMIVDELHIFSHAGCFKCTVCHCKLSNLIAGDSLWVYRDAINCDNCYQKMRDRWFH